MEFIYINPTSLSDEICEDIIYLYNKDKLLGSKGQTYIGVNTYVKDTWDLNISRLVKNENNKEWIEIYKLLSNELFDNLKIYISKLSDNDKYNKYHLDNSSKFKIINKNPLKVDVFQIQKYEPNIGKFIYHDDFHCSLEKKTFRLITFLWYLNNVEEGGETEFLGNYKIKPETGKLILFPATWTYPHCAEIPISNAKYIITGWVNCDA